MLTLNRPITLRLAAVCLIAVAALGCSKRRFRMPAGSMFPTLPLDSEVSADLNAKTPARGEIWVFHFPENPQMDFLKRIVGLPGDRIEMNGDTLIVNGKPAPSCVVGAYQPVFEGVARPGRLVLEKSDAAAYLTFIEDLSPLGGTAAWTTAPGEFFAMGDNRKNSHDSRSWYGGKGGGVPQNLLIGRVEEPPLALPAGAAGLAAAFAKCKADLGVSP